MRRVLKVTKVTLIWTLILLVIGEAVLSRDPLGVYAQVEYPTLTRALQMTANGWQLPSGTYEFRHWQATVEGDGTRRVPDSGTGAPSLYFVGDSVTFGYGVNDEQTWVNRVAQALPARRVINAGVYGYNSAEVRAAVAELPADARIVYLIFSNDPESSIRTGTASASLPFHSWLSLYLMYLSNYQLPGSVPSSAEYVRQHGDMTRFEEDLLALNADPRVQLFAFDEAVGRVAADCCGATLIPVYNDYVSRIDIHPNAVGHEQIADGMLLNLS